MLLSYTGVSNLNSDEDFGNEVFNKTFVFVHYTMIVVLEAFKIK